VTQSVGDWAKQGAGDAQEAKPIQERSKHDRRDSRSGSEALLRAAQGKIGDRIAEYDQPHGERSAGPTVLAFNAITGRNLTESEGWLFLQLLKDVRQWSNPNEYHPDSAIDSVAYAALKGEALAVGR